jgi:type I restriction enzyme S subunit
MVKAIKNTDVGTLPIDWDASDITTVIDKINGIKIGPFGSQLKKELLTGSGYKVYGQENVYKKDMEVGERYISKEHFKKLSSCEIKANDFLISMMGTIGKCMIVPEKFEAGIMDSHLIRLRLDKRKLSADLLLHFFSSNNLISQVKKFSVGGIMEGLSSKIVRKLQIPLPPTQAEQKAIATALNDTDVLITQLEKHISKKIAIIQAAMYEFLKPKENWDEITLSDIGQFKKGRNIPKNALQAEGLPCVLYGEIYTKYNFITSQLTSRISLETSKQSTEIKFGDILFAGSGETAEEIGKCFTYNGSDRAFAGGDVIVFTPNDTDPVFLGFLLNSEKVNQQKSFMGQGSSVFHIYISNLKNIKVSLPPTRIEQNQIAKIFSDMDAEMLELKKRLEKYKMIKQGIMQDLLTGRIRLINKKK